MGARHTLRGCQLRKKIHQERYASRATRASTSPNDDEFQKARIHISANGQRSTSRHVLVVSANDTPRVGAMDYKEARQIQAKVNRAQRRAEEQH
jgi:hypothetical protein